MLQDVCIVLWVNFVKQLILNFLSSSFIYGQVSVESNLMLHEDMSFTERERQN